MSQPAGPLAGIRIVMMGGFGPSPFCGMLLGDLGADVVRVDRVAEVDRGRPIDAALRRSQRSIALDMKSPGGRHVVRSLVERADAFVEVFRPGVAERMGIGPDQLLGWNRRLIYARMTGWGQEGTYAQMAGHDINYLALSGALHSIGPADTPVPPLNILGDYGGGGMLLALGLLSGILEARQSGAGQVIDVAMYDAAATLMAVFYGMLDDGRWVDRRQANVVDGAAHYYRTYETADGKHVAVGALEPHFYQELCAVLGVDVPHEETAEAWAAHGETMAARFKQRTRAEWEEILVTPQSCATPVLSLTEAPQHPHARARGTFIEAVGGGVQPAPAPRFSRTPAAVPSAPALPGDDTLGVLAELGIDDAAAKELCDAGVARQSSQGRL
jgi:alpha-methylacyl-CoA racemase